MKKLFLLFAASLSLTGCIGAYLSGQTEIVDEDFPDITTVPCRKDAAADRGIHDTPETKARTKDLKELESHKASVHKENETLRSRYF